MIEKSWQLKSYMCMSRQKLVLRLINMMEGKIGTSGIEEREKINNTLFS